MYSPPLPTDLSSTAIIRFQDCDPFGHLNNARYIDYFMNARSDHLATYYDFHLVEFGKQPSVSWVVTKNQIAYLAPAFVAEEVVIRTRLLAATPKTVTVEAVMLDRSERHVKAVYWMDLTYVSLTTGRPTTHDDELFEFLNSVRYEMEEPDFDTRVKALKRQYRRSKEATSEPMLEL